MRSFVPGVTRFTHRTDTTIYVQAANPNPAALPVLVMRTGEPQVIVAIQARIVAMAGAAFTAAHQEYALHRWWSSWCDEMRRNE
jgi:hypothetical protein